MRTRQEIQAHIKEIEINDPYGYETGLLTRYLENPDGFGNMIESIQALITTTWKAANEKNAQACWQGIHYILAYLWLSGDQIMYDTTRYMFYHEYQFFGKLVLEMLSKNFGLVWGELDDGIRTNEP